MPTDDDFQSFALAAAPLAAAIARYCDHVEHNEPAETSEVVAAGEELGALALEFAYASKFDLIELYAERLGAIENRNVLNAPGSCDGRAGALAAKTWRDLQLVQAEHDRFYHPDVLGLSKYEQLRHYAFHLSKVVGAFAEANDEDELISRRLPDSLLFAIKLRTVMGVRLAADRLPRLDDHGRVSA
jgi:hypothetical protein